MPATKSNPFAPEFPPFMPNFKFPAVDIEAFAAIQRKNVETMIEANRKVLEVARVAAEKQAAFVRDGLEKAGAAAMEAMSPAAPEKKLAHQAEVAKDAFDTGVANCRAMYELAAKTGEDVFTLVSKRISESFDEVKAAAANGTAAHAAPAAKTSK
jgi:phasin family protein